ncbi:TauD/TfdA family dioxygenase [Thalassospiraceae bacterium LMO-JJ14]|nr:TauD/TfdA family dioxygenase [Thalassospiraceae bacterium LMO-JJ14]
MSVNLTPIPGALGVEAKGIDLAGGVSGADADALRVALRDRLVLVIREQDLTPAQYVQAMRIFGAPMRQHLSKLLMPAHPEIAVLDSRVANTKRDDGKIMPIGSRDWHTDHTNHARPPKMTALYAVKLPREGGDTGFANMQAAYASLSPDEQAALAKLRTVNSIEQDVGYVDDKARTEFGAPQVHPFIRTHPETGNKAIYVHPGKLAHFEGWGEDESRAFTNDLLARVLTPEVTYRHRWQPGDLVVWDNRALLHVAHTDYDPAEGRILHRMCLEGDEPF